MAFASARIPTAVVLARLIGERRAALRFRHAHHEWGDAPFRGNISHAMAKGAKKIRALRVACAMNSVGRIFS
jgi:hypothetical protein